MSSSATFTQSIGSNTHTELVENKVLCITTESDFSASQPSGLNSHCFFATHLLFRFLGSQDSVNGPAADNLREDCRFQWIPAVDQSSARARKIKDHHVIGGIGCSTAVATRSILLSMQSHLTEFSEYVRFNMFGEITRYLSSNSVDG